MDCVNLNPNQCKAVTKTISIITEYQKLHNPSLNEKQKQELLANILNCDTVQLINNFNHTLDYHSQIDQFQQIYNQFKKTIGSHTHNNNNHNNHNHNHGHGHGHKSKAKAKSKQLKNGKIVTKHPKLMDRMSGTSNTNTNTNTNTELSANELLLFNSANVPPDIDEDEMVCNINTCEIVARNNRDRIAYATNNSLYFGLQNENEVVILQLLDKIHCYLLHSYDFFKLMTVEYDYVYNSTNTNHNNNRKGTMDNSGGGGGSLFDVEATESMDDSKQAMGLPSHSMSEDNIMANVKRVDHNNNTMDMHDDSHIEDMDINVDMQLVRLKEIISKKQRNKNFSRLAHRFKDNKFATNTHSISTEMQHKHNNTHNNNHNNNHHHKHKHKHKHKRKRKNKENTNTFNIPGHNNNQTESESKAQSDDDNESENDNEGDHDDKAFEHKVAPFNFGKRWRYAYRYLNNDSRDELNGKSYKSWFVSIKFESLKTEILENNIQRISVMQWTQLYTKTLELSKCNKAKQLKSERNCKYDSTHLRSRGQQHSDSDHNEDNEDNEDNDSDSNHNDSGRSNHQLAINDITKNDTISIQHLMSIILFCNFSLLKRMFLGTYYQLNKYEKWSEVRLKHSEYANFGRYLLEVIECFGILQSDYDQSQTSFYHALTGTDYKLASIYGQFFAPISMTSELSVITYFCNVDQYSNDLIIDCSTSMKDSSSGLRYFACNWLSDFVSEFEMIFDGGLDYVRFNSMLDLKFGHNYESWMHAFTILDCIFIRGNNTGILHRIPTVAAPSSASANAGGAKSQLQMTQSTKSESRLSARLSVGSMKNVYHQQLAQSRIPSEIILAFCRLVLRQVNEEQSHTTDGGSLVLIPSAIDHYLNDWCNSRTHIRLHLGILRNPQLKKMLGDCSLIHLPNSSSATLYELCFDNILRLFPNIHAIHINEPLLFEVKEAGTTNTNTNTNTNKNISVVAKKCQLLSDMFDILHASKFYGLYLSKIRLIAPLCLQGFNLAQCVHDYKAAYFNIGWILKLDAPTDNCIHYALQISKSVKANSTMSGANKSKHKKTSSTPVPIQYAFQPQYSDGNTNAEDGEESAIEDPNDFHSIQIKLKVKMTDEPKPNIIDFVFFATDTPEQLAQEMIQQVNLPVHYKQEIVRCIKACIPSRSTNSDGSSHSRSLSNGNVTLVSYVILKADPMTAVNANPKATADPHPHPHPRSGDGNSDHRTGALTANSNDSAAKPAPANGVSNDNGNDSASANMSDNRSVSVTPSVKGMNLQAIPEDKNSDELNHTRSQHHIPYDINDESMEDYLSVAYLGALQSEIPDMPETIMRNVSQVPFFDTSLQLPMLRPTELSRIPLEIAKLMERQTLELQREFDSFLSTQRELLRLKLENLNIAESSLQKMDSNDSENEDQKASDFHIKSKTDGSGGLLSSAHPSASASASSALDQLQQPQSFSVNDKKQSFDSMSEIEQHRSKYIAILRIKIENKREQLIEKWIELMTDHIEMIKLKQEITQKNVQRFKGQLEFENQSQFQNFMKSDVLDVKQKETLKTKIGEYRAVMMKNYTHFLRQTYTECVHKIHNDHNQNNHNNHNNNNVLINHTNTHPSSQPNPNATTHASDNHHNSMSNHNGIQQQQQQQQQQHRSQNPNRNRNQSQNQQQRAMQAIQVHHNNNVNNATNHTPV